MQIKIDTRNRHMPFFAISTRFLGNIYSTYYKRVLEYDGLARLVLPIQCVPSGSIRIALTHGDRHKMYYFLLMFGRPNLFVNSYAFLLKKAKPGFFRNLELVGITFFWTWFTLLLRNIDGMGHRIGYVLLCFIVTSPVHVQVGRTPLV